MAQEVQLTQWKQNLVNSIESFMDMYCTKGYVNPVKFPMQNEAGKLDTMFIEYVTNGKVQ